jgi:hypothetical protein
MILGELLELELSDTNQGLSAVQGSSLDNKGLHLHRAIQLTLH